MRRPHSLRDVHRVAHQRPASTPHKLAAIAGTESRRARGQQAIEPERVTQIQQALIREHYLTGEANGKWDATTMAAMQKYQADQGWQTKLMPDSRALKKLGLGPDYSTAINAKNSSFAIRRRVRHHSRHAERGFCGGLGRESIG